MPNISKEASDNLDVNGNPLPKEEFPIRKKGKDRPKEQKRHTSEEEKKKRRAIMQRARDAKKKKLKENEKHFNYHEIVKVREDNDKVKYGHSKPIRKNNLDIVFKYQPFPHQYRLLKALESGKRIVAIVTGIRAGKTYAGARQCLRQIYGTNYKSGIGWIVAPTYDLSKVAQRAFEEAAAPVILKKRIAEREYLLRPPRKGMPPYLVQIKTAEHPDRLRGAEVDWVWWDEAAMCDEETLDILMGRVLTTGGPIWITTTARGMSHWLYTQVMKKAEEGHKDYAVIQAETDDNPLIDREMLQQLKEKYTDEFREQEIEGKFVNFSGLIYNDFSPKKMSDGGHVFELGDMIDGLANARLIGGIDWGYDDPFVFLWIAERDGRYYVVDEYYRRGEIPRVHLAEVKRYHYTDRIDTIYSDVSRPESKREFQEGLSMPVLSGRTEREDLIPGIQHVASLFKNNRLFIASHCRYTINELQKYSWHKHKDKNSKDRPRDNFNHCCDALRYVVYSERNLAPATSLVKMEDGRHILTRGIGRKSKGVQHPVLRMVKLAKKKFGKRKHWMEYN